ncbi:DUF1214 domain-containing protein [Allorhizobium terrae]|uniref:DUF1214 domain-containing protein n=1 Tax=Allorhizobium terrae TaxID=1848972 RepID=A0A4S3ZQ50_9HYPH|nr:DUF1214 domain-containing protein [Allorhizobium terrae]THF47596.1 DUF1214 domain-containing protein [Allorhizobium terrae]
MFRVPLLVLLALVIAFGLGIQSTLVALNATVGFGEISIDGWRAFPEAQTASADPYARSHRARAGRLLLGSAEGLTFIATTDSSGQRLTGLCRYRLSGSVPTTRFWTLYATRPNGEPLKVSPDLPTALNSIIALKNPEGSMDITISAKATANNWLAVAPDGGPIMLNLTLLDTPAAGNSGLVALTMPRIERIGCGNV